MTAVTSKYSTNSGFEARGMVECKVLGRGFNTPQINVDTGAGNTYSFDSNSSAIVVLPIADANLMRAGGQVDF